MADFILGRLKFHFKGDWVTATAYIKDDVVRYGGNTFVAIVNHTSSALFETELVATKWKKFAAGTEWKGVWTATTFYKVDDVVQWGGSTFACNTAHTSQADLYDDTAKWTSFVPGFAWKGTYTNGTAYKVNDLAKYGANVYICTVEHTAASTIDTAKFAVFVSGLEFEDSWNSGTAYQAGDIVTYGGYNYVAEQQNSNEIPYNNASNWVVLTTGWKMQGTYAGATAYKTGDVVRYGGHTYVATTDAQGIVPTTTANWDLLNEGFNWRDDWTDATDYAPGDGVNYGSSSYRCKLAHTSSAVAGDAKRPDYDSGGVYWDLLAEGDTNATLTTRGDILTRDATQRARLAVGTTGSLLKSDGTDVAWAVPGVTTAVYFVGKHGADNDPASDSGRGTSLEKPWLTIQYALTWMAVTGNIAAATNKILYVKTGEYEEALPLIVPANTALIGDALRSTKIAPASGNSTASGLTSTPNARADMLRVRNGTTVRNFTFSGMLGTNGSDDSFGVARPNTADGASRSGVCIALDPGSGVSDTSVHITDKEPSIENCTHIGTGSVGIKVDGSLHNAGFISIFANDFTQVSSDGVGVWTLSNAVAELDSVFTYYCHHGYLADSGSLIRGLNSNNSYGEYGSTAAGIDAAETAYTGAVDLQNNEAIVGRTLIADGKIGRLEMEYAGEGYSSSTITIGGSGTSAAVTGDLSDGAIEHITVNTTGATQFSSSSALDFRYAQGGTTSTIILNASDTQADDFYNGMRINIYQGTGYGSTGTISDYVSSTKTATVQKNNSSAGFDVWVNSGLSAATTFDSSTGYEIEPKVAISGGGSPSREALVRAVIVDGLLSKVLILDGGAGYSSAPTVTLTDPSAGTLGTATATIGDGVISRTTVGTAGTGYKQEDTTATVAGDGYAEISSEGTAFVRVDGLSKEPAGGDVIEFAGISGQAYYVVGVTGYSAGAGTVRVSPKFTTSNKPTNNETATLRSNYSNIRLTGHDFQDVGTGDSTTTNYPGTPSQSADSNDEIIEVDRGRVFYSATDQTGNYKVSNLLNVDQSTGKATLTAEDLALSGLQTLSLGSTAQGNFGATINEFSTDGTLSGNSDTALVTEKGIKTYVAERLGGGQNDLSVNSITAGSVYTSGGTITTTGLSGTDVNLTIGTQNSGIITLAAQSQTSITPTTANDLVNKSYVDAQGTPTLQTLSIDDMDLALKRRVITNANELVQKESVFFDGTDATEGFEFINGTMHINIDNAGDLVIETI
jgi:hypothetical protein